MAPSRRFVARPSAFALFAPAMGLRGDNPMSTPIMRQPTSTERAVFLDTDPLVPTNAMVERGASEEEKGDGDVLTVVVAVTRVYERR